MSQPWSDPKHDVLWDIIATMHRAERGYDLMTDRDCPYCAGRCCQPTHQRCPESGSRDTHHLIPRRQDGAMVLTCIYCKQTAIQLEEAVAQPDLLCPVEDERGLMCNLPLHHEDIRHTYLRPGPRYRGETP